MAEQSVAKEIRNCASNVASSGNAALASGSAEALVDRKTSEAIDQAVYTILKETKKTPCSSLIRAIDPQLRAESFKLLQGTKAIANVVPAGEGREPQGGLVAVFKAVATQSDEERRKGQKAEIEELRSEKRGLGGVLKILRDNQKAFEDMQTAQLIVNQSSSPASAIHSVFSGVAAQDYFALAAGPIVTIFAIEMVFSKLRGYKPIGINTPGT